MKDRLKFRVWNTSGNAYVPRSQFILLSDGTLIQEIGGEDVIWNSTSPEMCTGLKDKNGKLIYEGDIVKTEWFDEKTIYQVVWDEKMACFLFESNNFFYLFDDLPADVTEIIGNIHENPEMLEQSNDN